MKTLKNFLLVGLILVISSCNKEELFAPIEEQTLEETSKTNIKYNIDPLTISLEKKAIPFRPASQNGTVNFKGQLWSIANSPDISHDPTDEAIIEAQIRSSSNGRDWTIRARNPFEASIRYSLVVFDGKMWKIGGFAIDSDTDTALGATYYTSDGINWHFASNSNLPHLYVDQAIVFNNKIYVFGGLFTPYTTSSDEPVIYSSSDGINWTLEASDALDTNLASAIVFNNNIYLMNAFEPNSYNLGEIWQSADGRNWSKVRRGLTKYPSTSTGFPNRWGSGKVVYNNKVWLIGGSIDGTKTNDIWFTKDMKNWFQYTGDSKFAPVTGLSALNFRDKIWLLGGYGSISQFNQIWSVKEKKLRFW
ncbi:hypothetical protein GH721_08510 [Kriegella sp. EG-1]|nr:hypothetical protein [Flavobacteriaceae bacterium EG-1]